MRHSARPDVALGHHRHVDQRDLLLLADLDENLLVGLEGHVRRHLARDGESDGKAGDGGFAMLGKGVVGARRDAGDGNVAAAGDHGAVGAVAAQHDDGRNPHLLHHPGGAQRVVHRAGNLVVEVVDAREVLEALVLGPVDAAPDMVPDAAVLGHHVDLVDAAGLEAREHPQHDVGPVGDLQCGRVGDHPADVACRHRIGDDPDGASHCSQVYSLLFG